MRVGFKLGVFDVALTHSRSGFSIEAGSVRNMGTGLDANGGACQVEGSSSPIICKETKCLTEIFFDEL